MPAAPRRTHARAPEADKEIPAHGVSIVEVRKAGGKFTYQKDSAYNRRITP